MRRSWLVRLRAQPNATARLVCVPYAGGGASAYQAWSGDLPDVEVWAAELPGRERRFAEPAATSIDEVVEPLGLGDDLVAVTFECDVPPRARLDNAVVVGGLETEGLTPGQVDALVREHVAWALARQRSGSQESDDR